MPNTYLQLADLPSAGAEDKGWLPCKNVSTGVSIEIGKFERGKLRTLARSEHADIEVKRLMDRASPFLHVCGSDGRMLKTVSLAFSKDGDKEIYLKLEMKNVYVSDISLDISDGEEAEETVKFNYEQIVWKIRPRLKSGQLAPWVSAGWDRAEGVEVQVGER